MLAFRNEPPHRHAMKRLLHWCDEASYVHWEQEGTDLPDSPAAYHRLAESGTLSKVHNPSLRQREGTRVGAVPPRKGNPIPPRAKKGR